MYNIGINILLQINSETAFLFLFFNCNPVLNFLRIIFNPMRQEEGIAWIQGSIGYQLQGTNNKIEMRWDDSLDTLPFRLLPKCNRIGLLRFRIKSIMYRPLSDFKDSRLEETEEIKRVNRFDILDLVIYLCLRPLNPWMEQRGKGGMGS